MIASDVAYAKINLSLDVISKRPDGYHDIRTIMQSIGLCDEITVECTPGTGIRADCGLPYIPDDDRNIAVKAAMEFYKHTGIGGYRTQIRINKKIPVCAGLGGGSADGACVIRMLDKMFETNLGMGELETIGGTVGSDVPFCICGGTSLAEGRGELLTALAPLPHCHIVVCKPPLSYSTPELFSKIKCEKIRARPDTEGIKEALRNADLKSVARFMYNVFEDVRMTGKRYIADIKYAMNDNGALGAAMTGSGPTVFGLFDDEEKARAAYEQLRSNYKDCFVTKDA